MSNTKTKTPITTAIKDGKLRTNDMDIGTGIGGEIVRIDRNAFGDPILFLQTDKKNKNSVVEVKVTGNLKFVVGDMESGKRPKTGYFFARRVEDRISNQGRPMTQFATFQEGVVPKSKQAPAAAPVQASTPVTNTTQAAATNLDEIRARIKSGSGAKN